MVKSLHRVTPQLVAGLLLGLAQGAGAQFTETEFRAGDGTAYQVLRVIEPLGIGAEEERVTTVAGSSSGVGGCNLSQSMSGGITAAIAGVLPPGQTLHPFNQISRTGILTPNDINAVTFFEPFGGRLQLGTGAGALNVCHEPFDCMAQPNVQTLVPLGSATGGIPAACIANEVSAGVLCDLNNVRNVFAFGLPATGNVCDTPANVTADTTLCAPRPADGFSLTPGQAAVFVYNTSLLGLGFSVGAAGFGIDTDGSNPLGCAANQIVSAVARLESGAPPEPPPTETPTGPIPTPTETFTPSATPTVTETRTLTPTPTRTPLCAAMPASGCRTAGRSVFMLKDNSDDRKDRLVWKWLDGAATDLFAFGNPVTGSTDYALCLYGSQSAAPALAMSATVFGSSVCGGRFCWKPTTLRGFRYRDGDGTAGQLSSIKLHTGAAGAARVRVNAMGTLIPMPTPADANNLLGQDQTVTVQLINSEGECWEAVFVAPAEQLTGTAFKDTF